MPRIRTIKPEFFRSPDTAEVSFAGRLFYQALWCWADDFGIGETNINGLLGFAFCDEDEMSAQDVRRFCAEVAQHYGVTFYTVRGRHYYAIPSWDKHQKTERRSERRKHPLPDDPESAPDQRFYDRADSAPELQRTIGADSRKSSAGTGEQGNRGTGISCASDDAPDGSTFTPATPERFDEFWDTYDKKRDRKKAEQKYRLALKKPGVTADSLIVAAAAYVDYQRREGKHPEFTKDPATWLNGECWNNELAARRAASESTRVFDGNVFNEHVDPGEPTW